MSEEKPELKVKCPVCSKKEKWNNNPYRPFCCQRCSMIDLGKWADDSYQIEGSELAVDPNETSPY